MFKIVNIFSWSRGYDDDSAFCEIDCVGLLWLAEDSVDSNKYEFDAFNEVSNGLTSISFISKTLKVYNGSVLVGFWKWVDSVLDLFMSDIENWWCAHMLN